MAYKGSDLDPTFKAFFRTQKSRITKHLKSLGCTEIKIDYGFHFYSGFFTSASGQVYYFSTTDCRMKHEIYYRTAKDYKDYTGGHNVWIDPYKLSDIKLK